MLIASVALPIWPLIGWGIFGGGGWEFVGLVIAMPILFLALAAVSLLIYARPTVRREKAVNWWDVLVLTLWHVFIIGFGLFGENTTTFAVLGVLAGIAAFWYSVWAFFKDAAKRARETLAEFEQMATAPTIGRVPPGATGVASEQVIIVRENPRDEP
ncbi:hypothetical protein C3E77_08970 [Mycetocola zhujimingii]|uniref:Uncharacterized protein n=2 Tax=Mycetocola zhujimingii TaxID=2079792 RepID=A0A2U1THC2_9MICO|nr:hypothetical protein C3E77_08970 [Mycetocola zhujimingii]PWC08275.1 hypothetical protein DF223_02730 [Mycetocola zhujimingii]